MASPGGSARTARRGAHARARLGNDALHRDLRAGGAAVPKYRPALRGTKPNAAALLLGVKAGEMYRGMAAPIVRR